MKTLIKAKAKEKEGFTSPSGSNYGSKEEYLKVKLRRKNTKFSRFFSFVNKSKLKEGKEYFIKKELGIDFVDKRIPNLIVNTLLNLNFRIVNTLKEFKRENGSKTVGVASFKVEKRSK